jgi:hypothetical protein
VASDTTKLTELGTAAGLVHDPAAPWPGSIEGLRIPGIDDATWKPIVLPVTATAHPQRELLLKALGNGHAFRTEVLGGRRPGRVAWTGAARATWTSDIPRDLTVDGVYFIQAKYDSTCVLNTAPATLVDHLLLDDGAGSRESWYELVALPTLQAYYRRVRGHAGDADLTAAELPTDVRDLDASHRRQLKVLMRSHPAPEREADAYRELCRAVSLETEWRWTHRLRAATTAQQTQMVFRMLRIAGGPYWLLGTKGAHPVRLAVTDTRTWRERFTLKRFRVAAAQVGQPQVDWRATVVDSLDGSSHTIEGYCEIRWSHGKLQGNPECKVQVVTPLAALPGYRPMAAPPGEAR